MIEKTYYWIWTDDWSEYDSVTAKNLEDAVEKIKEQIDIICDVPEQDQVDFVGFEVFEEADEDRSDSIYQETYVREPDEPRCSEADEHEWTATHEIEGGLEENPGVFSHGGGVVIHDHCKFCGIRRKRDTWAQNPATGEQGFNVTIYPDEDPVEISHTDED